MPGSASPTSVPSRRSPRLRVKRPKAADPSTCATLEQLPNIGPALAADLRQIGVHDPRQLAQAQAWTLYQTLCTVTGRRHDPCVLDAFMSACAFMRGENAQPWWAYTAHRKHLYGKI